MKVSAILLAGGKGLRMQTQQPKQYLELQEKPMALHSFDLLSSLPEVIEIIVVCEPPYRSLFSASIPTLYALPGTRRQDSCYNGFQMACKESDLILVHDAARPFLSLPLVYSVLEAADQHGAATLGMPLKFSVKEVDANKIVKNTPDRNLLWEIQTPQVIKPHLLEQGFAYASAHNLTVTDDVSLVERIGCPVKIVEGSYSNIKITTQDDLLLAERILEKPVHA